MNTVKPWSKKDERVLRQLYPTLPNAEIAARLKRSIPSIKSRVKLLRLRKKHGHHIWTADDDRILLAQYADTDTAVLAKRIGATMCGTYDRAHKLKLKKSPAFIEKLLKIESDRLIRVGAKSRFKPGLVPANKGLRRPGWSRGRMATTWFKKGQRQGAAAAHYVPIGSLRYSKEGYLQRKVREDIKKPQRNWVAVHTLLWEKNRGPVPSGYAVAFIDHDRTNIVIDNLELISRAELMRRNTIHKLPKALKEVIFLKGRVLRKIHRIEKEVANAKKHDSGSAESSIRCA